MEILRSGKKKRNVHCEETESPPCPICGQQFLLFTTMNDVYERTHNHFREHIQELDSTEGAYELLTEKRHTWTISCNALISDALKAARAAKQKKKLSPEELRAAQSRGGKNQLKSDKAYGGTMQNSDDKARGGKIAMHSRWHVRRGIKADGCALCALLVDT
jgi:hypothetical protein